MMRHAGEQYFRAAVRDVFGIDDLDRQPWMEQALCAQTDPELWFPELGGSAKPAKAVCGRCEVREQCLAYALKGDASSSYGDGSAFQYGVWGGLSAKQRRELEKAQEEAC